MEGQCYQCIEYYFPFWFSKVLVFLRILQTAQRLAPHSLHSPLPWLILGKLVRTKMSFKLFLLLNPNIEMFWKTSRCSLSEVNSRCILERSCLIFTNPGWYVILSIKSGALVSLYIFFYIFKQKKSAKKLCCNIKSIYYIMKIVY